MRALVQAVALVVAVEWGGIPGLLREAIRSPLRRCQEAFHRRQISHLLSSRQAEDGFPMHFVGIALSGDFKLQYYVLNECVIAKALIEAKIATGMSACDEEFVATILERRLQPTPLIRNDLLPPHQIAPGKRS